MSLSPPEAPPDAADHDPELARFLEAVVDLSARRHSRGPDDFIVALDELVDRFQALRRYRTEKVVSARFTAFARQRFDLVDDPSEYALAWDEMVVLSMALAKSASLAFPALKHSLEFMSSRLTDEGAVPLFGQMLKRTRQLARQQGDSELEAWVRGVVKALPGDEVAGEGPRGWGWSGDAVAGEGPGDQGLRGQVAGEGSGDAVAGEGPGDEGSRG